MQQLCSERNRRNPNNVSCILISQFSTTLKENHTPNVMDGPLITSSTEAQNATGNGKILISNYYRDSAAHKQYTTNESPY